MTTPMGPFRFWNQTSKETKIAILQSAPGFDSDLCVKWITLLKSKCKNKSSSYLTNSYDGLKYDVTLTKRNDRAFTSDYIFIADIMYKLFWFCFVHQ